MLGDWVLIDAMRIRCSSHNFLIRHITTTQNMVFKQLTEHRCNFVSTLNNIGQSKEEKQNGVKRNEEFLIVDEIEVNAHCIN